MVMARGEECRELPSWRKASAKPAGRRGWLLSARELRYPAAVGPAISAGRSTFDPSSTPRLWAPVPPRGDCQQGHAVQS